MKIVLHLTFQFFYLIFYKRQIEHLFNDNTIKAYVSTLPIIPERYVKKENPKKRPKDPPTEPIKLPVVMIKTSSFMSLVALLK